MSNDEDVTEEVRRTMLALGTPQQNLEKADVRYTTDEVRELFEVHSFLAPFVFVTRKADNVKGTLEFTHAPRWYFNFVADGDDK